MGKIFIGVNEGEKVHRLSSSGKHSVCRINFFNITRAFPISIDKCLTRDLFFPPRAAYNVRYTSKISILA